MAKNVATVSDAAWSKLCAEAGQALERIQAEQGARNQAKLARASARGVEHVDQEEKKAAVAKAKEVSKSMTKVLIPLASMGSREMIEKALGKGAKLDQAYEKGMTPAVAAIMAGHIDLAKWLVEHPNHAWVEKRLRKQKGFTELSAAVWVDSPELCEFLTTRNPGLIDISSPLTYGDVSLVDLAYHQSPRAAAWLVKNHKDKFVDNLSLQKKKPAGYYYSWYSRSAALVKALSQGDEESANAMFEHSRTLLESELKMGVAEQSLLLDWINECIKHDEPKALAWIMNKSERAARSMLMGVKGCGVQVNEYTAMDGAIMPAFVKRLKSYGGAWGRDAVSLPLALAAANGGAQDCLDMLLQIEAFRDQVSHAQKEGSNWLWESVFACVNDPSIVKSLQNVGFDFCKSTDDGMNYASMAIKFDIATVKCLEMIGREMSELLAPRALDNKTPFDLAAMAKYPNPRLSKMQAICDKVAIRSSASRSKATREMKAKSKPRRL